MTSRLRADEVVTRWRARAADRGLDPGPDALSRPLAARADHRGLFDAQAVAEILDELEGAARRRRERWRIRQLDDGLALVHDPLGARSSIRVPGALRHLADLERQAVILEDVDRALRNEPGATIPRLATRWAIGERTLARWRGDACHFRPELAAFGPDSGLKIGV
jgi:hypothetical protein